MLGSGFALNAGFKKTPQGVVNIGLAAKAWGGVLTGGSPAGIPLKGRDLLEGGRAFSGGGISIEDSLEGKDLLEGGGAFSGGGIAAGKKG